SELCTQCGLCCSGALHNYVALDVGETGDDGLVLSTVPDGRPGLTLPCPLLAGCSCSIYGNRPHACQRYKCQLLLDVESKQTDLASAADKVREAKRLACQVDRQ